MAIKFSFHVVQILWLVSSVGLERGLILNTWPKMCFFLQSKRQWYCDIPLTSFSCFILWIWILYQYVSYSVDLETFAVAADHEKARKTDITCSYFNNLGCLIFLVFNWTCIKSAIVLTCLQTSKSCMYRGNRSRTGDQKMDQTGY